MKSRARINLTAGILRMPLRAAFKHASAERAAGESLWVEAAGPDGARGFGEGCPRTYVTGETPASCAAFFRRHRASLQDSASELDALRMWTERHAAEIDRNPAAWCAIETALLDLLGRSAGYPLEMLLGLPPAAGIHQYTAVLGDCDPASFTDTLARYVDAGFTGYKLKVSGDLRRDRERVSALSKVAGSTRLDANNLWRDPGAAARYINHLGKPLAGIEEPLRPAGRFDELARLADALRTPVVLDESVLCIEQLEHLAQSPQRWIVNVRVSKMGGIQRSLDLVERGRRLGLRFIVGAQVGETSLLTRAALPVAAAAGDALVAQEGAFGTSLLEHDPCCPELRFGAAGELDIGAMLVPHAPGSGLEVQDPYGWLDVID